MTTTTTDHPLGPLPEGFATTRDALHQVAFFVLAPRRYDHAERLGLRALPGGFGTPWFDGPDGRERVRFVGELLVVETTEHDRATRPATVRAACDHVGLPYRETWFEDFHDPLAARDPDAALDVDRAAALALADWFAFGTAALDAARAFPGAVDPSAVQLWPEHFDPATELGSADEGRRASYGASPGDEGHDQPYLYVAPWGEKAEDPYWNDTVFGGASITYEELRAADDPMAAAVDFLRRGHELLSG